MLPEVADFVGPHQAASQYDSPDDEGDEYYDDYDDYGFYEDDSVPYHFSFTEVPVEQVAAEF